MTDLRDSISYYCSTLRNESDLEQLRRHAQGLVALQEMRDAAVEYVANYPFVDGKQRPVSTAAPGSDASPARHGAAGSLCACGHAYERHDENGGECYYGTRTTETDIDAVCVCSVYDQLDPVPPTPSSDQPPPSSPQADTATVADDSPVKESRVCRVCAMTAVDVLCATCIAEGVSVAVHLQYGGKKFGTVTGIRDGKVEVKLDNAGVVKVEEWVELPEGWTK